MSPRIWRRLSTLVVLILGIGALAAWRIHSNKPPEKTKRAPALAFTPDELTQPTMIAIGRSIELSGSLNAPDNVIIRAKSAGQLKILSVTEGQSVLQGETIGFLDLTELQSRLAERRASLAAAKTSMTQANLQWEANQRLAERGFLAPTAIETSRASLESAKALVQAAESALQTVQVQLRDADLIAPISGWVHKRLAIEGEKLAIEQPIVSILNTDRLEIHTQVAAVDAQELAIGRLQNFAIDGVKSPVPAQLSRIMPSADANSRSLTLVWLIQPGQKSAFRPGQFAIASIDLPGAQQRLSLPVEAIRQEGGQSVAWVVQQAKLQRKALITGRRSPDGKRIEILDGLDPEAVVLAARFEGLSEGQEASLSGLLSSSNELPARTTTLSPAKGSQAKP